MHTEILEFLPQFISGILSVTPFVIFLFINKYILASIINRLEDPSRHYAVAFISRFFNVAIIVIALLTMLGTWGVDIRALVAGLGLTGFALGFALKDVIANALAGIMIIFFKPIAIDTKVSLTGVDGVVSSIDLRYTIIEDEKFKHMIPNSKLLSERITILK
jgi:small-conductance mechanosensitive channel